MYTKKNRNIHGGIPSTNFPPSHKPRKTVRFPESPSELRRVRSTDYNEAASKQSSMGRRARSLRKNLRHQLFELLDDEDDKLLEKIKKDVDLLLYIRGLLHVKGENRLFQRKKIIYRSDDELAFLSSIKELPLPLLEELRKSEQDKELFKLAEDKYQVDWLNISEEAKNKKKIELQKNFESLFETDKGVFIESLADVVTTLYLSIIEKVIEYKRKHNKPFSVYAELKDCLQDARKCIGQKDTESYKAARIASVTKKQRMKQALATGEEVSSPIRNMGLNVKLLSESAPEAAAVARREAISTRETAKKLRSERRIAERGQPWKHYSAPKG